MSTPSDDELRALLGDAVDGVEPRDRLGQVRARTRAPSRRRRGVLLGVVAAAGASVAAVVATVGVLGSGGSGGPEEPAPVARDDEQLVALYFAGGTPEGERLFREFRRVEATDATGRAREALSAITSADGPDDPDYELLWPLDVFPDVSVTADAIQVEVVDDAYDYAASALGVQQVVHTVQAAVDRDDLPVTFVRDGEPVRQVGGLSVPLLIERAPQLEVLAPVSVSDPVEGEVVDDGLLEARGRASSFEGTVPWEVRDAAGAVVLDGSAQADGPLDRLNPWEVEIDVSDLSPGTYTFVASTSDPSGGAEGGGATSDTRTVVVE